MAVSNKRRRSSVGPKGKAAARIINERVAAGEPPTLELMAQAHDEAYGLKGNKKRISQYLNDNLKRASFLSELALDSGESKRELGKWLWMALNGVHPITQGDRKLTAAFSMKAATLIARTAHAEKHDHHHFSEGEFAGRTVVELEYYAKHGEWPAGAPIQSNASSRPQ